LAKEFEALTGIHIDFHILGEGAVVESIFKQISQGEHLYDIYINDADHPCPRTRSRYLTQYMQGKGKKYTNPYLELDDFLNLEFGQNYEGQQLQLPDQQFANLYWFRHEVLLTLRPQLKKTK
jgi:glycerol transport system substrate-binding protein